MSQDELKVSNFFSIKLLRILTAISSALLAVSPVSFYDGPHSGGTLLSLHPTTSADSAKLIATMAAKSSLLDVVPTSLMKSCVDIFVPTISTMANISFSSGQFPACCKTACCKTAQVLPLLKKHGLNKAQLANFRPTSNLNTVT
jgi:hypothetical protein